MGLKQLVTVKAVALLLLAAGASAPGPPKQVVLKMATPANGQYGATPFEPERLTKPYVPILLINARTGRTAMVEAYLDTGADHCVMSGQLFQFLGLARIGTGGARTDLGVGSVILFPTEAEYELMQSPRARVAGFPRQKTHFYVNVQGSEALVLGTQGFLDRFKEVTLRYGSREMEFAW